MQFYFYSCCINFVQDCTLICDICLFFFLLINPRRCIILLSEYQNQWRLFFHTEDVSVHSHARCSSHQTLSHSPSESVWHEVSRTAPDNVVVLHQTFKRTCTDTRELNRHASHMVLQTGSSFSHATKGDRPVTSVRPILILKYASSADQYNYSMSEDGQSHEALILMFLLPVIHEDSCCVNVLYGNYNKLHSSFVC